MRYICDNDLHIHSGLSLCSGDPDQTPERIMKYARENGIKTLCLTDHFWDERVTEGDPGPWYLKQNFEHISAARPLPTSDGVRFLFGCETEMTKEMLIGVSRERFDEFDFVVIPTTHFHMSGLTIPKDRVSPREKADFWVLKLGALLSMDLPFHKVGLAHLTCGLMDSNRANFLELVSSIGEKELFELFDKAARLGVGIELNSDDMNFADKEADIVLRPYRIAKKCGCKFYLGSDAHHPNSLDAAPKIFERAVDMLELTEEDKFPLCR